MKIAICISGMPRHIGKCYEGILNLFPGHNVDIFFHFWNPGTPDGYDKRHLNKHDILKLFSPKMYIFEEMKHFENNSQCMIYSLYTVNELKKEYEKNNNFIYDYVLRTRSDMIYVSDINKLLPHVNDKVLISYVGTEGLLNDMNALANSKIMDIYAEWFHHMKDINICKFTSPSSIHKVLVDYLKFRNVSTETYPFYCVLYRDKFIDLVSRLYPRKTIKEFVNIIKNIKLSENYYKNEKWMRMFLTNCEIIPPDKYNLYIKI